MLGFCYLYAYGTQAAHRRTGRMTDRETVGSLTPQDAMRPERPLPNRTLRRIRSERQDNPFDKEQRIGRMHRYLQRKRVAPGRAPAPRNGKNRQFPQRHGIRIDERYLPLLNALPSARVYRYGPTLRPTGAPRRQQHAT